MAAGGHAWTGRTGRIFVRALWAVSALGSAATTAEDLCAAELAWQGADGCENRTYVSEQVQALSGRSLEAAEEFSFEISVVRTGETWELVLVTRSEPGGARREKRLQGKSCSEVSDAAAVAIAMTLGGRSAATEEPGSDSEPPAPVAPAPEAPVKAPRPAPPKPVPRENNERARGALGIGAALDLGALPSIAIGPDISLGLEWRRLRVSIVGGFFPPNQAELSEGRGGSFELRYGALLACFFQPFGSSLGSGCAGYELGSLSGEGEGVDDPHLGSTLWQAPRLELGLAVPLSGSVRLAAALGVSVPLSRPEFVLDQGEVVHRPSAVTGRARAGVELLF